jgi:hypothetical protein
MHTLQFPVTLRCKSKTTKLWIKNIQQNTTANIDRNGTPLSSWKSGRRRVKSIFNEEEY